MSLAVTSALTGLALLVVILELLRRRQLREKYALLWLGVLVFILPVAVYPRLLDGVAGVLGIASGASLVFFVGFMFLLLVSIHLSWEVSRLEEETRTLAEDIALLRTEISTPTKPRPALVLGRSEQPERVVDHGEYIDRGAGLERVRLDRARRPGDPVGATRRRRAGRRRRLHR